MNLVRVLPYLLLLLVPSLGGQIKVDVKVVNILCTVSDAHGGMVTGLSQGDFEVRDNGKVQPIRYFARDKDLPLSIALLVDVSGSVRKFLEAEKETAIGFFRAILRPQDQAMLTGFSSTVVTWKEFTPVVGQLAEALETMHAVPFKGLPKDGGPMPTTLLYDSVAATASNKLRNVPGRKAMVIISDGIDIGSRANLDSAVREAQISDAVIYAICYPNEHEPGCAYLKSLSDPTGGRTFDLAGKTPLTEIFATIEQELRSQYSLGFVPPDGSRDGSFHKLQVRVRPSGLRVRSRKGYYALE